MKIESQFLHAVKIHLLEITVHKVLKKEEEEEEEE